MPHNSLLVLRPGAMEHWLHGVPPCAPQRLAPHAVAGRARVSLTFRMERAGADAPPPPPRCACGKPAWLKARPAAGAGETDDASEYFYACDPVGDARPCGFFRLAPWASDRAARYLREERRFSAPSESVIHV